MASPTFFQIFQLFGTIFLVAAFFIILIILCDHYSKKLKPKRPKFGIYPPDIVDHFHYKWLVAGFLYSDLFLPNGSLSWDSRIVARIENGPTFKSRLYPRGIDGQGEWVSVELVADFPPDSEATYDVCFMYYIILDDEKKCFEKGKFKRKRGWKRRKKMNSLFNRESSTSRNESHLFTGVLFLWLGKILPS